MNRALRVLLVLAVLALASVDVATAEVFKCTENGRTVFQDKPCSGAGTAITVTPANRSAVPAAGSAIDSVSRMKSDVDSMAADRKQREIAYEIQQLERDIEGYRLAQERELALLRARKLRANNNLAGATWEQSISTEMQAVTEKYRTLTQTARDRVTQLRQDAKEMAKAR